MSDNYSKQQLIQEEEYSFPYHYIPEYSQGFFSQVKYWSWGFRYLGGMSVVFDLLRKLHFNSLIDIGCGDGRFVAEASKIYPDKKVLGVDYSDRAIALAKAMNPFISPNFIVTDICNDKSLSKSKYDVVTLIEVLEHIPPAQINPFVKAIYEVIAENGVLIITVPHKNKKVQSKHYQHFNSVDLKKLLSPYFKSFDFTPFDKKTRVLNYMQKLIGNQGDYFVLTHPHLLNWFYNIYTSKYLYTSNEYNCGRIAVICKKK